MGLHTLRLGWYWREAWFLMSVENSQKFQHGPQNAGLGVRVPSPSLHPAPQLSEPSSQPTPQPHPPTELLTLFPTLETLSSTPSRLQLQPQCPGWSPYLRAGTQCGVGGGVVIVPHATLCSVGWVHRSCSVNCHTPGRFGCYLPLEQWHLVPPCAYWGTE